MSARESTPTDALPVPPLDEATSEIDVQAETQIHETLRAFLKGRTTILISHRSSAITLADRIAVMNDGQIVRTGTYNELLEDMSFFSDFHARHPVKKSA